MIRSFAINVIQQFLELETCHQLKVWFALSFLMGVSKLILPARAALHSFPSIGVTAQKTEQGQRRPCLANYAIAWQSIALRAPSQTFKLATAFQRREFACRQSFVRAISRDSASATTLSSTARPSRASSSIAPQVPQEIVEMSSDSGDFGDHSAATATTGIAPLPSAEGLQTATAISEWTVLWWQRMNSDERKATQATCYFVRSDARWYYKALPLWSVAQQRLLEPESEQAESERSAAFSADGSLPDSEAGAVYRALPRKAG